METKTTNLTEAQALDLFNSTFDDCYPNVTFGSLNYLPSHVLRTVDPIAYRCAFLDWLDSESIDID